ncbi:C-type lectin-like, partial [Trinorchestia longiramus]
QKILDPLTDPSSFSIHLNGTFIVGQEQDILSGGFATTESFRGKMALLSIWDYAIDYQLIKDMSACQMIGKGNLFSLENDRFEMFNVSEKKISVMQLCSVTQNYWLTNGVNTFEQSVKLCQAFGSFLYAPETIEAINELLQLINDPKCVCKFISNVLVGITDEEEEGTWKKISDGKTVPFHYFLSSETNAGREKNCAIMYRKEAAFLQHNCSEVWPQCAPCITEKPLKLRGLCFKLESESFMQLKGYVNGSIYIQGYHGIIVYKMLHTNEWHMLDTNVGKIVARIYLSFEESYPIGMKPWTIVSKICNHHEESTVFLSISACSRKEFACKNAECIPREQLCNGVSDCTDLSDESNCLILGVPGGYKKIRPPEKKFGNWGPIVVSTHLNVLHFIEVNDMRNMVNIELEMELRWRDRRLLFYNLGDKLDDNKLTDEDLESIWTPSLVFPSMYNGEINSIYNELHVMKNGNRKPDDFNSISTTFYRQALVSRTPYSSCFSGKFACTFHVFRYPFDHHVCELVVRLGYASERLVTFSNNSLSIKYAGASDLIEFSVSNIMARVVRVQQNTTYFSGIKVEVTLTRLPSVVMLTLFLPTFLLVCIGYSTLFVRVDNLEVRMAVALTTLLVLYTLFNQTSESLPNTAYVKMVDIWFFAVITLLFIIIVFHVFVEYLDQKQDMDDEAFLSVLKKTNMKGDKFPERKVAWEKEGQESELPEKMMRVMRLFVVPALFVVFNTIFWLYWF